MRRCLLAACLALPTLAQAWVVVPFTATYKFNIDGKLDGTATRTLEKTGADSYRYTFSATAPLSRATEISNFRYDGKDVSSFGYTRDFKVFFVSRHSEASFDWAHKLANTVRESGERVQYALKPGTLDELNLEIQVRRDIKDTGKPGENYWLGAPKNITPLKLGVQGEEIMDTPIGKLHVLKILRTNGDADRVTTFWLAKELDYAPAKVMQNDKGAIYTISITGYKATGSK
jgi:hypothetical protein